MKLTVAGSVTADSYLSGVSALTLARTRRLGFRVLGSCTFNCNRSAKPNKSARSVRSSVSTKVEKFGPRFWMCILGFKQKAASMMQNTRLCGILLRSPNANACCGIHGPSVLCSTSLMCVPEFELRILASTGAKAPNKSRLEV